MTETIGKQKHSRNTAIYCISKTFERASFYGIRALIVLAITEKFNTISKPETIELFGWFMLTVTIFKIVGAILGDLLFETKNAIAWGGMLQTLGCSVLCFNSFELVVAGLVIIAIGSGLYSSNILAEFARDYRDKSKIIDAGFSIYYSTINIGSFVGTLAIGIIGERYGYNYGFLTAGILMLIATVIYFQKRPEKTSSNSPHLQPTIIKNSSILIIIFISVIIFWNLQEFSFVAFKDIQQSIGNIYAADVNFYSWEMLSTSFIMFFSLLAAFVWSFFYYNQFKKIIVGCLSLAIGLSIVFFTSSPFTGNDMLLIVCAMAIIGFAEVHIIPVLNSIITQSIHPKYLAIALNISFIPGLIIGGFLINVSANYVTQLENTAILIIAISSLATIAVLLIILLRRGILKPAH